MQEKVFMNEVFYMGDGNRLAEENANLKKKNAIMVAVLAKIYPSLISWHKQSETGVDHRSGEVVYIQLPTGQISWHIRDGDEYLFDGIQRVAVSPWDGHGEEEKWSRIIKFISSQDRRERR